MKRILILTLGACALVGNLQADVVEVNGYFISSTDAENLKLSATKTPELTTTIHGAVVEVSAEQKARREWEGNVVAGGAAEDMAFDPNRRPTEIGEVLKNAGYSCTPAEIDTLRGLIHDYSWNFVISMFLSTETTLRRFRLTRGGTPAEIDQAAKMLFQTVAQTETNPVVLFVDKLVLKKHGLAD